jgi:uncharacterized protein (TIGR02001 family)
MKKALSGLTLLLLTATAQADLSANVGYMSEYHFRGILQKVSSVSGGVDYESGGFYVGTWAADVGDNCYEAGSGLEVDGYFGYGTEVGDVSLSVGYTGYFYTGDFDDTYQEINLGAGFGMLSLDVAIGKYDGDFDSVTPGDQDSYTFVALTLENNGFYGTLGSFSQDADGEYLELGYGTTVSDIDLGLSLIMANDDLIGAADESLVFTIGKTFDIN